MKAEDIAKLPTPETDKAYSDFRDKWLGIRDPLGRATNLAEVMIQKSHSLEQRLAAAVMALEACSRATGYVNQDDSVGYLVCCGAPSYKEHRKDCTLAETLAAIKERK